MSLPNAESDFDQWAATYDRDVQQDGRFPFDGYDRILDHIVALADIQPGRPVLELGTGTGNLTARLARQGAAVWGVDFSAEMLTRARAKVPTARLAQADLLAGLPPAFAQPFAVAVSAYVFHEFPMPEKQRLLERLFAHHLGPGAHVVIGDIGFPNAAARDQARREAGDAWDEEYYWLLDETHTMAQAMGLSLSAEQLSPCGVVLTLANPVAQVS
jgi:cyclopropane fatty-acyl-phospholipid synthase-like methyltransferase